MDDVSLQMRLLVNGVVVGPFEKEEERAGINSHREHGFRSRCALAASTHTDFPKITLSNFLFAFSMF